MTMANPLETTAETAGKTISKGSGKGLSKQVGPLPMGVWLAIIGGGLVISFYISNKNSKGGKNAEGTNTSAPSALVYTGVGGNSSDTTNATAPTTAKFQTNEAWAVAAKNYLISQGIDGKEASDAVDLYINGQALNAKQNAMVSNAIRGVGSPPNSLPPVTGTPTPTPGNTPVYENVWGKTPRLNPQSIEGTTYTKRAGDTLISIAREAYGLAPEDYSGESFGANAILNENHEVIGDVTNIPDGTKLYIPVLSSQEFPNFFNKIPQGSWKPGMNTSTGEWAIDVGLIPQSANAPRRGH